VVRLPRTFRTPLLPVIALTALLAGPRLCQASNDFSRRISDAAKAQQDKSDAPDKSGHPESTPTISAAPDVCVSKPDSDGRASIALHAAASFGVQSDSRHAFDVAIPAHTTGHTQLHAPAFHSTAPPACI